jgi:2-keto-4-pentenoate hydratase/2-oxohepta-3-ene-1,7-dioic acid hydratase in catechol pathway
MRFATARTAGPEGHRLFAEVPGQDGLVLDVAALAAAAGEDELARARDVGDLVRLGEPGLKSARRLVEAAGANGGVALDSLDLAPPVVDPPKIVCIGRNYVEHAKEGGSPVPEWPILFSKYNNALAGHGDGIPHYPITSQLDYEGELAVVVGRRASRVPAAEAMAHVAGYTIINDVSARDLQLGDVQWIRGKSLDGFAPMGPWFLPADEVADYRALRIQTTVNGELRQDQPAADMIFGIPELIAFTTEAITLEAGDIIATGTPAGVGLGFDPPKWIGPGDVVEVSITGLGTLRNEVVARD